MNPASVARTRTVEVTLAGASATRTVEVPAGARRTVVVGLPVDRPGRHVLRAGARAGVEPVSAPVRVVPADALRVRGLPPRAPVGSAPRVVVADARGRPVPGVAVSVGNRTRRTGPDGAVRVPLSRTGTATVAAASGDRTAEATVRVSDGARRALAASVRVEPARPTPLTRPVAVVRLTNPWNETLARTVRVGGEVGGESRHVRVAVGETATLRVPLARRPPGEHRVAVRSGGREVAVRTFEVSGGDRLVAAASTGARPGGVVAAGLGPALASAVDDLRLLAGVLLALAGLAALGATLSTFAAAVRARRATAGIHLAVGATRRRLLVAVLADALRVGAPAAVAGVVAGVVAVGALEAAGVLVVYGLSLSPRPGPVALAGLVAAGLALAVVGALGAAAGLAAAPPGALLDGPDAGGGDGD